MKRLLIILLLLCGTSVVNAQIRVMSKATVIHKSLDSYGSEKNALKYDESLGYFISMRTDNQFDDLILIPIGQDITSAEESLQSLLTFLKTNNKNNVLSISDYDGRNTIRGYIFTGNLMISADGYGGDAYMRANFLENCLRKIR